MLDCARFQVLQDATALEIASLHAQIAKLTSQNQQLAEQDMVHQEEATETQRVANRVAAAHRNQVDQFTQQIALLEGDKVSIH